MLTLSSSGYKHLQFYTLVPCQILKRLATKRVKISIRTQLKDNQQHEYPKNISKTYRVGPDVMKFNSRDLIRRRSFSETRKLNRSRTMGLK